MKIPTQIDNRMMFAFIISMAVGLSFAAITLLTLDNIVFMILSFSSMTFAIGISVTMSVFQRYKK